jgi:hypothetical protein
VGVLQRADEEVVDEEDGVEQGKAAAQSYVPFQTFAKMKLIFYNSF